LYISGKYFIVENGEGINQWQYSITIARRHSSDGGGYILPTCRILSPNRAVLFQLWFSVSVTVLIFQLQLLFFSVSISISVSYFA